MPPFAPNPSCVCGWPLPQQIAAGPTPVCICPLCGVPAAHVCEWQKPVDMRLVGGSVYYECPQCGESHGYDPGRTAGALLSFS